jgi:zinc protease
MIMTVLMIVSIQLSAEELLHQTLDNGMEVVVKENRENTSVSLYCFVKTGSIHEDEYLGAGISHYLEHLVSSGTTEIRTESDYQDLGQEIGAVTNAYTSHEITAYHITVDKEYLDTALMMLSEQIQYPVFTQEEVDREREVILKEIVMRSTPPRAQMYQRFFEVLYPQSNKKYPVIGYINLFRELTRNDIVNYYNKRYVPNNMVFVAAGDLNATEVMDKIESAFEDFERGRLKPVHLPSQPRVSGNVRVVDEFAIQQPTVIMSTILPSVDYPDTPALQTAFQILFGRRQAPLRYKLVEELELVNFIHAYASKSPTMPEGEITIIFEAKDVEDINRIIDIIDHDFSLYAHGGITQEDIDSFVSRQRAQLLLQTPSSSSECNRLGWNIIRYGTPDYHLTELDKMEKLTPEDLHHVIQKHIVPKDRIVFTALPLDSKKKFEEMEKREITETEITKRELSDQLTMIHRQNTRNPVVRGLVYMPLTTDYETKENIGSLSFMTELMFTGSKNYPPLALSQWLEDHVVSLDVAISSHGTFIDFRCLSEDLDKVVDIITDCITNPLFDKRELSLAQERANENFRRSLSSASTHHSDFRRKHMYDDNPASLTSEERLDIISVLTQEDLFELYNTYFNADEAIITFFGDIDMNRAEQYAQDIFSIIPQPDMEHPIYPLEITTTNQRHINEYGFEEVNIDIAFRAPTSQDDDFYAFTVLNHIFGLQRGRIHTAVRGERDLAYFAQPQHMFGNDYGIFRLITQTSLDKMDDLIDVLMSEVERIKVEPVEEDEIRTAIDGYNKMLNTMLTDNNLPYYVTRNEILGLGYDFHKKYDEVLYDIDSDDIIQVANKYLSDYIIIVSKPDDDVKRMVD